VSTQAHDPAEFLPRRRPSQERSRRRFDDILRAARALLVEVGFEAFTSEQVALRAGVPIGSLYQFFGNKYAIICELDRLDTVNVQAELERFATEIPSLDWAQLLEKLLDHLAALWRTDPSRRAVWLAMQATPPTRAIAAEHERGLAAQVTRLLAPLTPGSKLAQRQVIAEVVVHVTYSMLNFSIRDGQSHPDAVVHLKTLLTGYLLAAEAAAAKKKLSAT
jgi:AcrR family transcriptional regulator